MVISKRKMYLFYAIDYVNEEDAWSSLLLSETELAREKLGVSTEYVELSREDARRKLGPEKGELCRVATGGNGNRLSLYSRMKSAGFLPRVVNRFFSSIDGFPRVLFCPFGAHPYYANLPLSSLRLYLLSF